MSDTRIITRPEVRVARDATVHLRLKESERRPLVSKRKGVWLLAGLALALFLFATDGGGTGLYVLIQDQASQAQNYLVRGPGAPLAFLNSSPSREKKFQLQGIVYSQAKPLAIVNATSIANGELASVRVGKSKELIECLEIHPESIQIKTSGGSEVSLSLP